MSVPAEAGVHAALRTFFSSDSRILEWGIAPAQRSPRADLLATWIRQGHHAGMEYMAARLSERQDPQAFHAWAQSAVVFAFPYAQTLGKIDSRQPGGPDSQLLEKPYARYRVAAYAGGEDYHDRARMILKAAEEFLHADFPDLRFYGFVDTAPVFERDLASEAGLGWRGKNCCTLNRKHGSAFHLAGFFLDIPLPTSQPVEDFCGGCTRCLDQCPTQAFVAPGRLDSRKCISYWTIEAKGAVPEEVSKNFQGWIFGCDVCQEVCPWNHKHIRFGGNDTTQELETHRAGTEQPLKELQAHAGTARSASKESTPTMTWPKDGVEWLRLLKKGGGFQSRFKKSPLTRAGRRSLIRNLAIAARNLGDTSVLADLEKVSTDETDQVVRDEITKALLALTKIAADESKAAQGKRAESAES